jgi:hypothetical protein
MRAQSLIGFTLVSVPLFLVILGTFELILVSHADQAVRYAAAEGARLAALCNDADQADREQKVSQRVIEVLQPALGVNAERVFIAPLAPPVAQGDVVSLSIQYRFDLPVPLLLLSVRVWYLTATAAAVADKPPGHERCVPVA